MGSWLDAADDVAVEPVSSAGVLAYRFADA